MGARYYDPARGRFTQLDPLGNGYPYASDDPVNRVDPSGMDDFGAEVGGVTDFIGGTDGGFEDGGVYSYSTGTTAYDSTDIISGYANVENYLIEEAQSGGGYAMAGAGTGTPIRDIANIVEEFGGNSEDWAKMSTPGAKLPDGRGIDLHWYENVVTGEQVDYKFKVGSSKEGTSFVVPFP
jgi:uncharacterized protein RhaS with RHS repeats